jgi:outer membrane protein assembly factor BamB
MKKLFASSALTFVLYLFYFQIGMSSCTKPHDDSIVNIDTMDNGNPPPPPPPPIPIDSAEMIYIGGRTHHLYAIKASTGEVVWTRTVSGDYTLPAVYTQGVVAMRGHDGYMTAFDTTGKQLWRIPPVGGDPGQITFSPVADKGTIYSQDYYKIYAINANDGAIMWSYNKYDQGNGSGGIVVHGSVLYTTTKYGDYLALDINTGAELWKKYVSVFGWMPFVHNGIVYAYGGSSGFGNFRCLDSITGEVKYSENRPNDWAFNMQHGKIYQLDGSIYDSADIGTLLRSNPIVQVPLLPFGSTYPLLKDSLVILTTGVFNAFTGQLVAYPFNADPGEYLSGASYVGGVLFYSGGQRGVYRGNGYFLISDIYAFDVKGNRTIWRTEVPNSDITETEPVVVTKSGVVHKGSFVTR